MCDDTPIEVPADPCSFTSFPTQFAINMHTKVHFGEKLCFATASFDDPSDKYACSPTAYDIITLN